MGKKSDFTKVFGGGKTNYDFKVKNKKKSDNYDVFFNDVSKKKKKKKKNKVEKIDKIVKRAVGATEDSELSEFLVWDKVEDTSIKTFKDLGEQARGVFILEVALNSEVTGMVPVVITDDGTILHTESGEKIELVLARYSSETDEITEIDIATAEDALKNAAIIENIYNLNIEKVMKNINYFSNLNVTDF